ncbi:MAG: MBL fold metallo-hydrolase [Candidatus Omnitrophica bacterium]|nr:MBL fold metallo-hydrolase [Candidatus Omnitrophota bacterium]
MKITEKIHCLKIPFQIKISSEIILNRFAYVYIALGDKLYMIDTGVSSGENLILDYIKEQGRSVDEIDKIFLTHSHPDHIGALKLIKQKTKALVHAHKNKISCIENTELQFSERPVPGFKYLVSGSAKVDILVKNGDIIKLENGQTVKVIYTPGHSDDSVSYFFKEDKILISGDLVLLPGDIPIYDNYRELKNSLNMIKQIDFNVLLSSWDEPRYREEALKIIDKSIEYLDRIDAVVKNVSLNSNDDDIMLFCKNIVEKLRLTPAAVNPLCARSFMSHID